MSAKAPSPPASLVLYGTANSDCSTRLQLALNLKGLDYEYVDSGSPGGDRRPPNYTQLNPSNSLPTLVVRDHDGQLHTISQSIAALEYLDETFPEHLLLLPKAALARAQVRTLVAIIASDTHPMTAPRVGKRIAAQFHPDALEQDHEAQVAHWDLHWIHRGLDVYEQTVAASAGLYSVGDIISQADICLLPEAWRAISRGVDIGGYPIIQRIVLNLEKMDGIMAAHWDPKSRKEYKMA
jgi:maleylacetoacetate isomerase